MAEIRYVSEVGTFLVKKPGDKPRSTGSVQLLLGARLHLDLAATVDGFAPAASVPREDGTVRTGYVDLSRVSSTQQLKVFYLDVGQGDATIIEAEDVETLTQAAQLWQTVLAILRLTGADFDEQDRPPATLHALLSRLTHQPDIHRLEIGMQELAGAVHAIYDRLIAAPAAAAQQDGAPKGEQPIEAPPPHALDTLEGH